MIDLHTHSTYSDGSETPSKLVETAIEAGLTAIALTDHDNLGGVEEFLDACRQTGLTGLAGVELSVDTEKLGGTCLHILGYGINPEHPALSEALQKVLDGREWRNGQILERLREVGIELEMSEVQDCAGGDVVSRVHIAQAMVNRNEVSSIEEAFAKYLDHGQPAYVSRYKLYPDESIRLIHEAGGAAVMAHPLQWSRNLLSLERCVANLREMGLDGIEARYPRYHAGDTYELLRLAKRYDLFPTGGSDFHGDPKPDIRLGLGFGHLDVPDEYLAPLLVSVNALSNPYVYLGDRPSK